MHFRNIGWYPDMMMKTKATYNYTKSITVYDSECDRFHAYITASDTLEYPWYVLHVGGREEIAIFVLFMWFHAVGTE